MADLIDRQAAIETIFSEPLYDPGMKKRDVDAVVLAIYEKIKALPPVQLGTNLAEVGTDLVSERAAIDALTTYIYNVYKAMTGKRMPTDKCRQAAESVIGELPPVQPKNGTLIIPLNESDFKSVKRIILDNKPWCRTFYEDVPGEAHWIKSYTPDDGELYECDNCGVTWQFNDGGPEENEAFYCPKCGFKMVPKEGEENGQK